jgi:hypothetical protein
VPLNQNIAATKLGALEMDPKILIAILLKVAYAILIAFRSFMETVSLNVTLVVIS